MRLLDFFFAARPLLHLPAWSVYLVSLEYHHRLSGETFRYHDFIIMIGLSLMGAGALYLNQVYDVASDSLNDKLWFLQRGLLTQRELTVGFLILSILALATAALISSITFAVFVQLFLLALLYSASLWRLKDRPVWGLFANAYGIGFLASVAVMPDLRVNNSGLLGWDNPFYFLFAVASTTALTTIPDRAGDAAAGKRTVAVALGEMATLIVALLLSLASGYVAIRSGFPLLVGLAAVNTVLILAALMIRDRRFIHIAIKLPLLLLTLVAGYYFPWYLMFIVVLVAATRVYYRRRFSTIYPRLM